MSLLVLGVFFPPLSCQISSETGSVQPRGGHEVPEMEWQFGLLSFSIVQMGEAVVSNSWGT